MPSVLQSVNSQPGRASEREVFQEELILVPPDPSARLGLAFLWTAKATLSRSRSFKKGWGRVGFVFFSAEDPERQGLPASCFKTT